MLNQLSTKELIAKMSLRGVVFAEGLNEVELQNIESSLGGSIPKDLRIFLSIAVPIATHNSTSSFPRWDLGVVRAIKKSQSFVNELFKSDIQNDDYWNTIFGNRPLDKDKAWEYAFHALNAQPKLIPVYAHRYMIIGDNDSPVISFHGPLDTIVYGTNLTNYLCNEFDIEQSESLITDVKPTGFWGELIG